MRVRPWLASLVLIGIAGGTVPATAQDKRLPGLPSIGLPLPPIGLPLPSIAFPLPPIGAPLPPIGLSGTEPVRPMRAVLPHRPPNSGHRGAPYSGVPIYGAFYPVFYPIYYPVDAKVDSTSSSPGLPGSLAPGQPTAPTFEQTLGLLRLEVDPTAGQQIFVDGSYVGTPDDLDGDLALEAGVHVIELQAAGFDSARIPVRIVAGRTTTYRGSLQSSARRSDATGQAATARSADTSKTTEPAPSSSDVSAPPTRGYYIPGCYLGNVPPEDVALPEGCDAKRVVIVNSLR
jgi:hypothetical protein